MEAMDQPLSSKSKMRSSASAQGSVASEHSSDICGICLVTPHVPVELNCKHSFCNLCLLTANATNHSRCPICRQPHILDPVALRDRARKYRSAYSDWRKGGSKGSHGELKTVGSENPLDQLKHCNAELSLIALPTLVPRTPAEGAPAEALPTDDSTQANTKQEPACRTGALSTKTLDYKFPLYAQLSLLYVTPFLNSTVDFAHYAFLSEYLIQELGGTFSLWALANTLKAGLARLAGSALIAKFGSKAHFPVLVYAAANILCLAMVSKSLYGLVIALSCTYVSTKPLSQSLACQVYGSSKLEQKAALDAIEVSYTLGFCCMLPLFGLVYSMVPDVRFCFAIMGAAVVIEAVMTGLVYHAIKSVPARTIPTASTSVAPEIVGVSVQCDNAPHPPAKKYNPVHAVLLCVSVGFYVIGANLIWSVYTVYYVAQFGLSVLMANVIHSAGSLLALAWLMLANRFECWQVRRGCLQMPRFEVTCQLACVICCLIWSLVPFLWAAVCGHILLVTMSTLWVADTFKLLVALVPFERVTRWVSGAQIGYSCAIVVSYGVSEIYNNYGMETAMHVVAGTTSIWALVMYLMFFQCEPSLSDKDNNCIPSAPMHHVTKDDTLTVITNCED